MIMLDDADNCVEPMITITRREYDKLCEQRDWLIALETAGVDNWDGIAWARELSELPCDGC